MLTTTIYLTYIYLAINNNLNFVLKYQIRNLKLKKKSMLGRIVSFREILLLNLKFYVYQKLFISSILLNYIKYIIYQLY